MAARFRTYAGDFKGYPPYAFSNLSGNLGRQKKRLVSLKTAEVTA